MTAEEKLEKLRKILKYPLDKYKYYKPRESHDSGDSDEFVDMSFCYDMASEWFNEGYIHYEGILEILTVD